MINLLRSIALCGCAAGAAGVSGAAESAADAVARAEREIAALLAAQPRWSVSASAETAAGHRDNLLLSAEEAARSGFTRGTAEVVLLRFPTGAFDYNLFLLGERTEYWEREVVNDEWRAWLQTTPAYRMGESWRVALPLTGYYNKQVFDYSITAGERDVAALRVRGGMAAPLVRWAIRPAWWLEVQGTGEQKRYEDRANDGTVGTGAVRLGWIRGERLEVRFAGIRRWRNFDHREQYSGTAGRPVPGSVLKISERELAIDVDVTWDAAKRWTTNTRMSLLHHQDNGSGYFNYREQRVAQELEWGSDRWLVRIGGAASRLDYGVQKIGLGLVRPARFIDDYSAELRVERKLSARWTLFVGYEWERNRSNDLPASYRVNEGLLGVRWGWER